MKKYTAKLKHDNSMVNLIVTARNKMAAIIQVMKAERCPMCAIVEIKEIK